MASNSKKRRRVLGVSCILAALIIASSSFAWFTSKDEVTNRLSASGDYGVSIVESFAPPANWLPGQEVNKDVYAVNTGEVEAFVEETVSGTLTITREKPTTGLTTPNTDCIELSAAERYAIEAGAYLAYAPKNSNLEVGRKVIAMTPDFENEYGYTAAKATDFTPDAAGLYVFRRVINYPLEGKQVETFEYDAYYYVPGMDSVTKEQVTRDNNGTTEYKWTKTPTGDGTAEEYWSNSTETPEEDGFTFAAVYEDVTEHPAIDGKFYKVSKLSVTPDETLDLAGDGINTDGNLKAATAGFYKDVTETFDPAALRYEDANENHGKRLVVTYDLGTVDNLNALAKAYDDALIVYQDAVEEYKAALRDLNNTTNPALTGATNNLQTALDNMRAAENAKAAAEKLVAQKQKELEAAQAAQAAALDKQADAQTAYNQAVAADEEADLADQAAQADLDAANRALGGESDNYDDTKVTKDPDTGEVTADTNSAYAKYNKANTELNNTTKSDRTAFENYIRTTKNLGDGEDAVTTYLANVTYEDLLALEIDNNDDVGYDYYEKLVAKKKAEKDLQAAKDAVADATAAKAATDKTKQETSDAKSKAQQALEAATNAVSGAGGENAKAGAAQDALTAAQEALGDEDDTYDNDKVTTDPDTGEVTDTNTAWAKYNKAKDDLETARTAYDAAKGNADTDTEQLRTAEANYAAAAQALSEAEKAYNEAVAEDDGEINIFINLSDNVITTEPTDTQNDKWQLLPSYITDDTAHFYYTGILGGGETTTMLIDSVTLDSTVTQEMFKYLDFDLNVDLKSAQIAMDNDGETILTTAADTILDADATLLQPTSVDTAVKWGVAPAAAASTYTASAQHKVDGGTWEDPADVLITRLPEPKTVGGSTYTYQIVDGGKTYFGDGLTSDKVFKQVTATTTDGVTTYAMTDNGDQIKLAANATPNP